MKTVLEREMQREFFTLVPVEGSANVYTMHFEPASLPDSGEEMTEADWDQFEKEINDACEQVP